MILNFLEFSLNRLFLIYIQFGKNFVFFFFPPPSFFPKNFFRPPPPPPPWGKMKVCTLPMCKPRLFRENYLRVLLIIVINNNIFFTFYTSSL